MRGKFIRTIGFSAASRQLQMMKPKMKQTAVQQDFAETKKEIDYEYFYNSITKRRKPCMLREIADIMSRLPSNSILFGVGVPNVAVFPFESININLKDGASIPIKGKELEAALQYLPSAGYLPLLQKLRDLQDKVHGKQDWNKRGIMVTSGAQEALYNGVMLSLNTGDSIIMQSPVYPGAIELLRPHLPRFMAIPQDKHGMRPDILRQELERAYSEGIPLPKMLYVNPTGCNPTGVNLSDERKREIYQLACDYNFLILEDDPYYFLHFMDESPTSFLSLDTEGRVLRFDSFSKVMSSGLRLGFVTAPKQLLRKMELKVQVSTLHSSGLSQMVLYKVLEKWGLDKLLENFDEGKEFYKQKRDLMIAACEKHLTGLAEWNVPEGGLFLWLRVNCMDDTYKLAVEDCIERFLLIVPGHPFYIHSEDSCVYIRLSYSLPTPEQMDEGCYHLAELIKKQLNNK